MIIIVRNTQKTLFCVLKLLGSELQSSADGFGVAGRGDQEPKA